MNGRSWIQSLFAPRDQDLEDFIQQTRSEAEEVVSDSEQTISQAVEKTAPRGQVLQLSPRKPARINQA